MGVRSNKINHRRDAERSIHNMGLSCNSCVWLPGNASCFEKDQRGARRCGGMCAFLLFSVSLRCDVVAALVKKLAGRSARATRKSITAMTQR
jgi:hypothetical protein